MNMVASERSRSARPVPDRGIVTLTHRKLRQPQDIGSKTTSEYSIGWLGPSATR